MKQRFYPARRGSLWHFLKHRYIESWFSRCYKKLCAYCVKKISYAKLGPHGGAISFCTKQKISLIRP